MGSRTRCLGLALAMMAVNTIYTQSIRQQELWERQSDTIEDPTIQPIDQDPLQSIRSELDQIQVD